MEYSQEIMQEIIDGSKVIRDLIGTSQSNLFMIIDLINVELAKKNFPLFNSFSLSVQYNPGQQPINKLM